MIDQNTLVEMINTSLPVLVTSAATSPVLIQLVKTVENVVKTLYEPRLAFRNGKAEVDVELYRKQKEIEFLENQTFTLYEVTKLKNFVKTANFAAEELQKEEQTVSGDSIDFDWIMRFFDAVGNVSNEELQKLWGKVLAGEIKQSGTCSLRTIDIIRNMSQKEAEIYNKLCKFVVSSGDCYFIFHSGFSDLNNRNQDSHNYILKTGLNYSDSIIPMIECGLLSVDNDLATDFAANKVLGIQNQEVRCFIIANKSKKNFLSIEPYFLTTSGVELYKIIGSMSDFEPNNEYPILCFKELKKQYPKLSISAHRINSWDDFDEEDLLENV